MGLSEDISHWLGRAQAFVVGENAELRAARDAMAHGDAVRARSRARDALLIEPGSPLALAVLADACTDLGLDAELERALEDLAMREPGRADVWLRLASVRLRVGAASSDVEEAWKRAIAVGESADPAPREAALALADADLARGEGTRALVWLERATRGASGPAKDSRIVVREVEALLASGRVAEAASAAKGWQPEAIDGRASFALGRVLLAGMSDRAVAGTHAASAFTYLLRAVVLDVPQAARELARLIATHAPPPADLETARSILDSKGLLHDPEIVAAFASAKGDTAAAKAALLATNTRSGAKLLFQLAASDKDRGALMRALELAPADDETREVGALLACVPDNFCLSAQSADDATFDTLTTTRSAAAQNLAEYILSTTFRSWFLPLDRSAPDAGNASGAKSVDAGNASGAKSVDAGNASGAKSVDAPWSLVSRRINALSRLLNDAAAPKAMDELFSRQRERLCIAIVGEFNAGKSTFINALMGADVAPTGILPTTATVHHLRYGMDELATIDLGDQIRNVAPSELRATLKSLGEVVPRRVVITLPLARLARIEVLDTPGFNAPDPRHREEAERAIREADLVLWLLDAGQPMKHSEREIMVRAHASGIPVQIIVNKTDKLSADELASVIALVEAGLAESKLASYETVLALSAKEALRRAAAGEAPRDDWSTFESFLDAHVLRAHDRLKERSARRRAMAFTLSLRDLATSARAADETIVAAQVQAIETRRSIAQRIAAARTQNERELERSLTPVFDALKSELSSISADAQTLGSARESATLRYRMERALALLSPPLELALVTLLDGAVEPTRISFATHVLARSSVPAAGSDSRSDAAYLAATTLTVALDLVDDSQQDAARAARATPLYGSGAYRELSALHAALVQSSSVEHSQ